MTITTHTTPRPTPTEDQAVAVLVGAFAADPVIRWVYPDPVRYLEWFPTLVRVLGAPAFDETTVGVTDDDAGVALWVRPGSGPDDEALGALVADSVDAERHDEAFAFLEQVGEHHPDTPVWYLPFIGVDPCHQGRGHGSALLASGLARVDEDGSPAYLEASTVRNRALYERHGFEVVGEIRAGDSPPLWPMLRPARQERRDDR
jgi:ribosomal protein S18 acetylase RimI-like enzyme